jgi:hypothetical protein
MFIVIGGGAAWFVVGLVRERNAQRADVPVPDDEMDTSTVER